MTRLTTHTVTHISSACAHISYTAQIYSTLNTHTVSHHTQWVSISHNWILYWIPTLQFLLAIYACISSAAVSCLTTTLNQASNDGLANSLTHTKTLVSFILTIYVGLTFLATISALVVALEFFQVENFSLGRRFVHFRVGTRQRSAFSTVSVYPTTASSYEYST